jgi:hypothetical protein
MGRLGDCLITVDSQHSIRLTKMKPSDADLNLNSAHVELQAHREAVKGVKLLPRSSQNNAAFFTWSSDGSVLFWDFQGRHQGSMSVELEQFPISDEDLPNELRVMQASPDAEFYVSGDRYGVLRYALLILFHRKLVNTFKAKLIRSSELSMAFRENAFTTLRLMEVK